MSLKKRTRTLKVKVPILKAKCEDCGALLVKAHKVITRSGKILCKNCVKKYPYEIVLRWIMG